jgi:DNA adenine methylase
MGQSATSFARKWQMGATDVVRVPRVMKNRLLEIARAWDETGIEPTAYLSREPAPEYQLTLPCVPARPNKPVNVASVPQLSPFRYPGGKTWLIPTIRQWLLHERPNRLFEPFGGGSIVSLTAAFENLAQEVVFCELDSGVGAVWKTILSRDWKWLATKIIDFEVIEDSVREELSRTVKSTRELAFQTILRNRVQRGGIMAPGAGLVRAGENGRGLLSRWYPTTLARRIEAIHEQKARIRFLEGDAFEHWDDALDTRGTAIYIDPPYVKAGKRLYSHWQVPHEKIFMLSEEAQGPVLMSYDNTAEVVRWASDFNLQVRPISMKNTHHATMDELLISKNFAWKGDDRIAA